MSWIIQVLVDGEWKPLRASHEKDPYKFDTEEEADRMMNICYPDQVREQRLGGEEIVKVVKL